MAEEAKVRIGDVVRVTGGPFAGFKGPVGAVDFGRGRVRLTVDILGDMSIIDVPLSDVAGAD
ncbi:KOW motif-containing protein [Streptomyces sp. 351MFTsu5.1]|uniref:KOW motif-containing protein n=1 Tax=Streptomyces sp. 351MFTsu5.1 TaxID=1172180 RepID=UPI000373B21D|nr:KOW motif-containing protein [Streptomyces sp. 351MFTsu5.1]